MKNKITNFNIKSEKGYALYMAIVLTGILFLVAYYTLNISLRQFLISSVGAESHIAFYNADSGIECAMYWDLKNGSFSAFDINTSGSINCNGQTITTGSQTVSTFPSQSSRIGGGGSSNPTSIFQISFTKGCAIVEVGQLDRRGGEVLSDTVSDFLGIPIDGYVRLPKNASGEIHNIFSAIMFALQARQTDLSLFDRIMFAWSLARMRYDKMDVVDLGKSSSPLLLADGSAGQSIEKDLVDNLLQDEFSEDKIRAEDLRIQVVNSTQYAGLGSRGARILNNSGMKVVSVDTTDLPVDKCQLRMDPKLKNSITIQRIESVFVCEVGSPIDGAKGDIVVVLGTNYLNKLTK
jgi:hypothetical protein